jgi:hypothetical protein
MHWLDIQRTSITNADFLVTNLNNVIPLAVVKIETELGVVYRSRITKPYRFSSPVQVIMIWRFEFVSNFGFEIEVCLSFA